jgi:hypothetical protein
MEAVITASYLGGEPAFEAILPVFDQPMGDHLRYALRCALNSEALRPAVEANQAHPALSAFLKSWDKMKDKPLMSKLNAKDLIMVFSVGGGNLEKNVSPGFISAIQLAKQVGARIGQELGLVDALARAFAPAMGWMALPAEAGIVWVTGALVGAYAAIAAMIALAPSAEMSVGQFSALSAMVLLAHGLPVEQAIVRRAGAGFWATSALRVGAALFYGAAVAWTCRLTGWLSDPVDLSWLQGSSLAGEGTSSWLAWVVSTATSLAMTLLIIVVLLVLLDALERLGITRRLTAASAPLLRLSGIEPAAAPVTTVGVLLGLSYGGALIIEEAERRNFSPRTRFLALSWLSLSHSLLEDTALFMALGADFFVIFVGRVALTLVVVAALARWIPQPGLALAPGR